MRKREILWIVAGVVGLQLSPLPTRADMKTLNFDDLTPGNNAGNVYQARGVVFTTGTIPNDIAVGGIITFSNPDPRFFVLHDNNWISPPNFAAPIDYWANPGYNNDLLMSFTIPVTSVQVTSDRAPNEGADLIRLLALEATGTLYQYKVLAFVSGWDNATTSPANLLKVDLTGSAFHYALFQTTTEGEGFDDLTFSQVTSVPVPAAVLLGALGLSVAGWRLRRATA